MVPREDLPRGGVVQGDVAGEIVGHGEALAQEGAHRQVGVVDPSDVGEATKPAKRVAPSRERRAVASKPPAVRRPPRMQARKVHRLVRHIEPWSVLKISLIFFFCIWVILLTSAVILWKVASSSGVIDMPRYSTGAPRTTASRARAARPSR